MNCPSRTDEPPESDGYNQNPSSLSADLTTREDLNGKANSRVLRRLASSEVQDAVDATPDNDTPRKEGEMGVGGKEVAIEDVGHHGEGGGSGRGEEANWMLKTFMKVRNGLINYSKFIGPGFMVSRPPTSIVFNLYTSKSNSFVWWDADLSGLY